LFLKFENREMKEISNIKPFDWDAFRLVEEKEF